MAELTLSTPHSRHTRALTLRVAAIAWRNLWRNGRRTWLGAGGIAFALMILVVGQSTQQGSFSAAIDNGARLMTGHLQIQHPMYQDDPRLEHLLSNASSIRDEVLKRPGAVAASIRAETFALASVGERSFGAQIVGVQSRREVQWSTLPAMVDEGRYLKGPGEAYVGAILARNLGATVGDEIVVLGTAKEGGVAAAVA
ncbi:MAG: ABC transporter permease, partial [Proteobacteria bacterium]|nr:ABC transporter permease [Pseudomonadota bacterium]